MDHRYFNSIMPKVNELWTSGVLGIPRNPRGGPDLIDGEKIVEIKFKFPKYSNWKILQHQANYRQREQRYWALGNYRMAIPVAEIHTTDIGKLENMVVFRELYIVEWNWMQQFEFYMQKGRTKKSEWENWIAFPKEKLVPEVVQEYSVGRGVIKFTMGVNSIDFQLH